jgi:hypothetical protein
MKGFLHRLTIAGSVCALITGAGLTAAPALAATTSYPCTDITLNSPTPMHSNYTDTSSTVKQVPVGETIGSYCQYINNTYESRWYMQSYYDGLSGWIWVQKLYYGQSHECFRTIGEATPPIGSNLCPLTPKDPGS